MVESLRARLLVWHTAMVAVVIVVFGGTLCYLVWRARLTDVDANLTLRADVLSQALQPVDRGTFDLTLTPTLTGDTTFYHALWTAKGALIDRSDEGLSVSRPTDTGGRTRDGRREFTVRAPSGATVLVGHDLADLRDELWSLAALLAAAGAAVLGLSVAGAWFVAGRTLAPITRINRTARRMVGGDLSARIPVDRVETELGQMARALNDAFDRLQASLDRQRRLTADISHELRTPLATLSTEVQWALGRNRSAEAYHESLDVCRRAAVRMQSVVERLLSLARAQAPVARELNETVSLDKVVQQAAADLAPLASSRELTVTVDAPPCAVTGDPDRLLEAITNVVTNAITYNVAHGRVKIHVTGRDGSAEVSVTDTGIGIAPEDVPLVFDPFFRADHARSRDAGGAGLGLAITRAIVERRGGEISCTSELDRGTEVVIRLPT